MLNRRFILVLTTVAIVVLATAYYAWQNNIKIPTFIDNNPSKNEDLIPTPKPISILYSSCPEEDKGFIVKLLNWPELTEEKEAHITTSHYISDGISCSPDGTARGDVFVRGDRPIKYNSASESIIYKSFNVMTGMSSSILDTKQDYCNAIFKTDFQNSEPILLYKDKLNYHSYGSFDCLYHIRQWGVHPQLPLLFVVTQEDADYYLTVLDINNPDRNESFGPLPRSIDDLFISSDGKLLFQYIKTYENKETSNYLMSFNILTKEISTYHLPYYPSRDRTDFPITLRTSGNSFSPNGEYAQYAFSIIDIKNNEYREIENTSSYAVWNVNGSWSSDSKLILFQSDSHTPNYNYRRNNAHLNTNFAFVYDLSSDSITELPFGHNDTWKFIPGTHKILRREQIYDVDTGTHEELPNKIDIWPEQWIFPNDTGLNFSFTDSTTMH